MIKSRTYLLSFEQKIVESLRKLYGRLVENIASLLDANNVLGPILEENTPYILRVACCDKHDGKVKVLKALPDKFTELLRADQLSIPVIVLKEQVLACELIINNIDVLLQTHHAAGAFIFFCFLHAMARDMQDRRLLANGLLKVLLCGNLRLEPDFLARLRKGVLDGLLLLAEIQGW